MVTTATSTGARVLLTGCTGVVGKVVLEELARRRVELGIEQVYVLIRPRRK
jgi:fatty acyl-CoA reductase